MKFTKLSSSACLAFDRETELPRRRFVDDHAVGALGRLDHRRLLVIHEVRVARPQRPRRHFQRPDVHPVALDPDDADGGERAFGFAEIRSGGHGCPRFERVNRPSPAPAPPA